jgi:molybdenum cofactor guanylyltransferase
MGRDKAFLEVDGEPMVLRVARVLADAGASRVVAVGGDAVGLQAIGMEVVPDPRQGDGPLAGIAAALHAAAGEETVMVVACDLVDLSPAGIRTVIGALHASPDAHVAVPVIDGRPEPLHTAWRPSAGHAVEAALDAGERAVHPLFERLTTVSVTGMDPRWFANINTPADWDTLTS